MIVLEWGELTLSVDPGRIYTFNGFDWSMGYKSEEKEVKKKKPKLAAQAPQLEQINFNVRMSAALGVYVPDELQKWKAANDAGTAYELFIGGSHFGGSGATWRIKSLKISEIEWNAYAQMLSASLAVSMEEYISYPSKKKKKKKKDDKKPSSSVPSSGGSSSENGTPITERYRNNR